MWRKRFFQLIQLTATHDDLFLCPQHVKNASKDIIFDFLIILHNIENNGHASYG